jgi:transposase
MIEWTPPCVSIGIKCQSRPLARKKEESVEEHTVVAVDVAKAVFELAVSEEPGRVKLHRRLSRGELEVFFAQTRKATVVMEACGSAHHWGRQLQALGHQVVLLPPHQVRPYVTRNKTDRADAKGILEAYRNSDLRPVPVKSVPQQVLGSIHRFRAGWIGARTAQVNTLRGLLRELGFVIPEGIEKVLPQVRLLVADAEAGLPDSLRGTVADACDAIESLGENIRQAERQLEALAEQTPVVERLRTVPGIGLMTSTALVAFVGDVQRFPSGRHFASYLGLTPREYSSGLRHRRGRISKRGDSYLRLLLVHGARSVLCHAKKATSHDRLRTWALSLQRRTRHNKAAVALANKLARIAWAVWKNGREYESMAPAA